MAEPRASLAQHLLWRLEALAFDLFVGLIRLLPVDTASDFGGWLVKTLGPLTSTQRVVERNLELVFPNLPADQRARLIADQWESLGRFFVEHPILDRIINDPSRVEIVGAERLAEIAAGAGPVVFISGHFSNMEVMSAVIVNSGVKCQITYRAANNPYIEKRFRKSRWRYGVRDFAPKGEEGARDIIKAMARGESVALMNDQKFNGGIAAPFFGHLAHTAPGPSKFALRFGAPLQPMSVQRTKGARFRVVVHEPIHLADTGDRSVDLETAVRRVNAFMEERIRERPHEWWWVHKRWPNEIYKKARAAA
ncbi:MAG: lysophospholipid acyltransferase family protein [Phenylobacterium sp.]|jgi:KDO2-lipid IV(A) lauroyltransferase|uniref:lysophospholipid acyltransferase family protein n=1 Tax=Phenylobacterium sp. TaxID=1871053 RepID=UPI002A35D5DB|nr:lysophospholipid acyltransferase family protein [Phenylobacterium sp.]MDX9998729.1 lysophospholipid acyltransferase family protein [Phenylobacterium sp.]